MGDSVHRGFSSGSAFGRGHPNSASTFLNINHDSGLAQFLGQALVLPAQFLHLVILRIAFGLGAALVRGEALEDSGLTLAPPGDQVGRVESFAAQQGAEATRTGRGSISLGQDGHLVLGGEGSTLGDGHNFRVRTSVQEGRVRRFCPRLHSGRPRFARSPYVLRWAKPWRKPKRFR
jgi:hypothetical protein